MNRLSELNRKLENDECFDEACRHDSVWKVLYRNNGQRTQTRLCDQHMAEFLIERRRPRALVRIHGVHA